MPQPQWCSSAVNVSGALGATGATAGVGAGAVTAVGAGAGAVFAVSAAECSAESARVQAEIANARRLMASMRMGIRVSQRG